MSIQSAARPPRAVAAYPGAARERMARRLLGPEWKLAYPFVIPMLILMFAIIGWPLVQAVSLIFTRTVGFHAGPFVGLQNVARLGLNREYANAIKVDVEYTFWAIVIKLVLGLVAALVLSSAIPFRNLLTGMVLIPWIIPEVVKALTWRMLYQPQFGGLNLILERLHILKGGVSWLGDPNLALPSVVVVDAWGGVPFFTIVLLSGLKSLDRELFASAAIDGANAFRQFLHITLPGVRTVIVVVCLLSSIWTFNGFGLVYLLTAGGPGDATMLYSILAYQAISGFLYSEGTTIALSTAPVVLVAAVLLGRAMMPGGREDDAPLGSGALGALGIPCGALTGAVRAAIMAVVDAAEDAVLVCARALARGLGRPPGQGLLGRRAARRSWTIAGGVVLSLILVFELFPFYWAIITAFKTEAQIERLQNVFWPRPWTAEHFAYMWTQTDFPIWIKNTISVAVITTILSVSAAALGAYALVRLRWRGARFVSATVLFTYLVPSAMLLIPMYKILSDLHVNNSVASLVITYPSFILPFATWLLMGYYRSIPEELEEAALIDGCTRIGAFARVVVPLAAPALLATSLFAVTSSWNEFLYAFTFIFSDASKTLPVGLAQMVLGDVYPYGNMMAASVMMAVPVAILYVLGQRSMVDGLTAGGVKGGG